MYFTDLKDSISCVKNISKKWYICLTEGPHAKLVYLNIYHFLEVFFTHDIESFKSVKYIYLKTIKNKYTSFACGPSYIQYWFWIHCKIIYFDSWLMMPTHQNRWCFLCGASKRRSPLISIHEVWKKLHWCAQIGYCIGEFLFGKNIMYNIEQQLRRLWLEKML